MNARHGSIISWLLEHYLRPFALAQRANELRRAYFEDKIALRAWPEDELAPDQLLWSGRAPTDTVQDPAQPAKSFKVDCDQPADRAAFLEWISARLSEQAQGMGTRWGSVSAWSVSPSSTQRSWLIASLRILAPASIRVQARVDALSLRSAQLCLNFGADSLAAPLASRRQLPIAGVVSPHESSTLGLATLIEQAGLVPDFQALHESSSS